jgi:hypothetical protein
VAAYRALHDGISAYRTTDREGERTRGYDLIGETALLRSTARYDRRTGRVHQDQLAPIIAKIQQVVADNPALGLGGLLSALDDAGTWPPLILWTAEPEPGFSGYRLEPRYVQDAEHRSGAVIVPIARNQQPNLLELVVGYLHGLMAGARSSPAELRTGMWRALEVLPVPAKILRHELDHHLAEVQAERDSVIANLLMQFVSSSPVPRTRLRRRWSSCPASNTRTSWPRAA